MAALQIILREPHKEFHSVRVSVPIDRARHLDTSSLGRLMMGTNSMASGGFSQPNMPLARILRGHVPTLVEESNVEVSYDTAENRFVKSFLGMLDGVVQSARELYEEVPLVEGRLLQIQQHGLWRGVGRMVTVPASSQVLQRRRGYREVYKHFVHMRAWLHELDSAG